MSVATSVSGILSTFTDVGSDTSFVISSESLKYCTRFDVKGYPSLIGGIIPFLRSSATFFIAESVFGLSTKPESYAMISSPSSETYLPITVPFEGSLFSFASSSLQLSILSD